MARRHQYYEGRRRYGNHHTHRSRRSTWKSTLIMLCLMILTIAVIDSLFTPPYMKEEVYSEYRVLSVYKGALHVVDLSTGQKTSIKDNKLVKMALQGQIKKGDVIKVREG